jgi:glycosyltransferase involved in cell wall biosynthesis
MFPPNLAALRAYAETDIIPDEKNAARGILSGQKVCVFVVAYNAEKHLESVIARIHHDVLNSLAEVFIIDDSSTDNTYNVAITVSKKYPLANINVYRTPFNRGYGGNQKLGYVYCIQQGFDIVILLHGDGQYAPEYIPRLLAPFQDKDTDAVFASRMMNKRMALKGGMPYYKWAGNQILTAMENSLLGTRLTEFHTGFRAFRVPSLGNIPFVYNSDDFHFDTEIIIQAIASKWKIREVSIPTHYGEETCHVSSAKYAYNCVKAVIKYKLVRLGLYYERNYDFDLFNSENYQFKKSPHSLHQHIINNLPTFPEMISVELGANKGLLSSLIAKKVKQHMAVDKIYPNLAGASIPIQLDLNTDFSGVLEKGHFDCCISLDVIEHMNEPENFVTEVHKIMKANGKLYISTANICYLPMRISLLLGQFNYGKKGILDKTHKRLFSIRGLKKLLVQGGFRVESVVGFAPPLSDLVSDHWLMGFLEKVHSSLARVYPKMFSYNFLLVATRMDDLSAIFDRTTGRKGLGNDPPSRVTAP